MTIRKKTRLTIVAASAASIAVGGLSIPVAQATDFQATHSSGATLKSKEIKKPETIRIRVRGSKPKGQLIVKVKGIRGAAVGYSKTLQVTNRAGLTNLETGKYKVTASLSNGNDIVWSARAKANRKRGSKVVIKNFGSV